MRAFRSLDTGDLTSIRVAGELLTMAYNAVRPDHKPEARAAAGGKAY